MAVSKQIKTSFWKDEYVRSLKPDEKLIMLYYILSDKQTVSGVYEISRETVVDDTGVNMDRLKVIEAKLSEDGKIVRHSAWVWVINTVKHLRTDVKKMSHTVKTGIRNQLDTVPRDILKGLGVLSDTRFLNIIDLKVTPEGKLTESGDGTLMTEADRKVLTTIDLVKGYFNIESKITPSDKTYAKRLLSAFDGDSYKVEALCRLVKYFEQTDYPYVIHSIRALYNKRDKIIARWKRDELSHKNKRPMVGKIS